MNLLAPERINQFCRPGDEIICIRIFSQSVNSCFFCGRSPLETNYVLVNTATNQSIDTDELCVAGLRKILLKMGSDQKILFFPKYKNEVNFINSKHEGTADLLEFSTSKKIIKLLLLRPNELDYRMLKHILDHTCKFTIGEEKDLFHTALDLYCERKYYLCEMLGIDDNSDLEMKIGEYLRLEDEKLEEKHNNIGYPDDHT